MKLCLEYKVNKMRNIIRERLLKSILLMGISIVLIVISVVFLIMFSSENEAVMFSVLGFFLGITLLIIGILIFRKTKKMLR